MPQVKSKYSSKKYTPEFREQTALHVIENGKTCTQVAKDLGIDLNSVCKWTRLYRQEHGLPSWAEERGRQPKRQSSQNELAAKNKELERELRLRHKEIESLEEDKEILKKSLAIFARPHV